MPDRIAAHKRRVMASSWAYHTSHVVLDDGFSAAFWRSVGAFQNNYLRDLAKITGDMSPLGHVVAAQHVGARYNWDVRPCLPPNTTYRVNTNKDYLVYSQHPYRRAKYGNYPASCPDDANSSQVNWPGVVAPRSTAHVWGRSDLMDEYSLLPPYHAALHVIIASLPHFRQSFLSDEYRPYNNESMKIMLSTEIILYLYNDIQSNPWRKPLFSVWHIIQYNKSNYTIPNHEMKS